MGSRRGLCPVARLLTEDGSMTWKGGSVGGGGCLCIRDCEARYRLPPHHTGRGQGGRLSLPVSGVCRSRAKEYEHGTARGEEDQFGRA